MTALLRYTGNVLGLLAGTVAVLTVASLPWMLGGVVPAARLALLSGATVAACLSFLACLFRGKLPGTLPALLIPLVGLALLGTFQLRPSAQCLTSFMVHAASAGGPPAWDSGRYLHSLSPADTRSTIATLLGLALLASVTFDQIRSQRMITAASLLFLANAGLATVIGLSEVFGQAGLSLNEVWFLGRSQGLNTFAGFINPNNAAGWLCLAVAMGTGWITWYMKPSATAPKMRRGRLRIPLAARLWQRIIEITAELTVWQALAFASVTFLTAGVAATRSRGGIVALAVAVILAASIRSSIRKLPIVLLLLAIGGSASYGFLRWLSLDTEIVGEIKTLKDLSTASAVRVDHWMDSLNAVKDFPLTGTGFGSYRFATLPYLTQHTGLWFRHADNYYVDMVVEGGLIGLLLLVAVGLCGLLTGFAAWQQSKTQRLSEDRDAPRISRRFLAGIGTAVVLATLTQACAGFFDNGISLPAAGSLLVIIVSVAAGYMTESAAIPSLRTTASLKTGALVAVPIQLCLIAAAGTYLKDQYAAVEVDNVVVVGHRILRSPVEAQKLDRLSATRTILLDKLKTRSDDPEGLRLLCRLTEAQLRWQVLLSGRGDAVRKDPALDTEWKSVTLISLFNRLKTIERTDKAQAGVLRSELVSRLTQLDFPTVLQLTQRAYPLMPAIPVSRAVTALLLEDSDEFHRQVEIVRFCEPATAGTMFGFGALAQRAGDMALADEFWQRSLSLSDAYQVEILTDGAEYRSAEDLLHRYGPSDYASCIRAVRKSRSPDLSNQLWNAADEFWLQVPQPADEQTSILRAEHLLAKGRYEDAFAWLQEALETHSDNPILLRHYAKQLERNGQFRKALDQWHRIQFLDPESTDAEKAISRLRKMN